MDSSNFINSVRHHCARVDVAKAKEESAMQNTIIAVDIAKNIFEVAVSRRIGVVAERHRLSRRRFLPFFAEFKPTTVLLEACGTAHHWARQLQNLGHKPILLPAHATRPYVLRNKTDQADAKALLEASRNKDIKPVPVKSIEQQALMTLHRLRSGWMSVRTARLNAIRGHLRELGFTIPLGARLVVPRLWELLEDAETNIPQFLRPALAEAGREVRELEQRILDIEKQLREVSRQSPLIMRLRTVPGIGLLTATALVAFVGNVQRFSSGRRFACYLGITPREYSSGQRRRLGHISKRGDVYLRTLLIHGARSVLNAAKRVETPDRLRVWVLSLEARAGHNRAAVALANKMARIAWAVWRDEREFQSIPADA
jgi:transposase